MVALLEKRLMDQLMGKSVEEMIRIGGGSPSYGQNNEWSQASQLHFSPLLPVHYPCYA